MERSDFVSLFQVGAAASGRLEAWWYGGSHEEGGIPTFLVPPMDFTTFPSLPGDPALSMTHWMFDQSALQEYILLCCQCPAGGLLDKPGK